MSKRAASSSASSSADDDERFPIPEADIDDGKVRNHSNSPVTKLPLSVDLFRDRIANVLAVAGGAVAPRTVSQPPF
jgi:hypothetical protein